MGNAHQPQPCSALADVSCGGHDHHVQQGDAGVEEFGRRAGVVHRGPHARRAVDRHEDRLYRP